MNVKNKLRLEKKKELEDTAILRWRLGLHEHVQIR